MPDSSERSTPKIRDKYSFLAYKSYSANLSTAQTHDSDSVTPNKEKRFENAFQHSINGVRPTQANQIELLLQDQLSYLHSIRNMLLFFTVFTCVGFAFGIICVILLLL